MEFPKDSLQSVVAGGSWWEPQKTPTICRGALILAFVPHVDQLPFTFEPVGRKNATAHSTAVVKVAPLRVDAPLQQTTLPVAAMVAHGDEVWGAYRAKKRPCLVLGCDNPKVDSSLTRGKPNHATAPTFTVAPFYGATSTSSRVGYNPDFIERIRHCEYPQYVWDYLPHSTGEESVLRLDQVQPIGAHHNAYKLYGFKLTEDAMEVVDDLLRWMIFGRVQADSLVAMYREEVVSSLGA